jgi:molecular chaperone DnaK
MAADCVSLGMFNLSGIPPAPRGVPQIEVAFDIDANGILNSTARDLATQKEAKITITANNKLSKDEIERLKRDSEQFADADKKKKEEAEIRNEADNLIYAADKLVKQDLKDKVSPDQVEKVNKLTQEIRDAIASNNIENIKTKMQELKNILGEISTQAYQSAAAGASSAQAGAAGSDFAGGSGGGGGPTGSTAEPTGSAAGPNPSP